jgi:uracil phosphoribosyltransferase
MRDHAYDRIPYSAPQLEHRYGSNVRILADPLALTQLARLCAKGTYQPEINTLVAVLYRDLLRVIVNAEFTRRDIARAGTLPSQITYDFLNTLLDPRVVRQDHFVMARVLDEAAQVTGAKIFGSKIGGDVDDAILLFPDPMGATGGSMCTAIEAYKKDVIGKPRKIIAANLIVTPEYLKRITTTHPEAIVYALRLDRGLSPEDIFDTVPGTHWDRERGLDDKQYIVPGGGGFGEIMNNAYV